MGWQRKTADLTRAQLRQMIKVVCMDCGYTQHGPFADVKARMRRHRTDAHPARPERSSLQWRNPRRW